MSVTYVSTTAETVMNTEPTMADLLALMQSRPKAKKTLPRPVQKKLAEKREWARAVGVCSRCDDELVRDKDGVLRSTLVTQGIGGPGHPLCGADRQPHVLDPRRTYYAGAPARETGTDGDGPDY